MDGQVEAIELKIATSVQPAPGFARSTRGIERDVPRQESCI